jgi:endonuclease YncB( thermonuclease family)
MFKCFAKNKVAIENIHYSDTKTFVPPITIGKVIAVYDGNTFIITSQLPYKNSPFYRFTVRMRGIQCPTVRWSTPTEKENALNSRIALEKLILGKIIRIDIICYGRDLTLHSDVFLGDVYVNKWMIDNYHATETI